MEKLLSLHPLFYDRDRIPSRSHITTMITQTKINFNFSPGKFSLPPTIIFQQLPLTPLKYIQLLTQVDLELKRIFSVALEVFSCYYRVKRETL